MSNEGVEEGELFQSASTLVNTSVALTIGGGGGPNDRERFFQYDRYIE